ncbi:hypothetical protein [Paenibacillus campi]|uniref:hypothetical protein n=1 Tax=Paenibacillus campi TaxID=3106031 RepID=UPI002AFF123E|nr:hypothetical protein [Paenibacillus sp. SGZ-1009]
MTNLKYYSVHMELKGRVTQLPDSQKIFGTLIHQFSNRHSPVEASKLVDEVKKNSGAIFISNLLPSGYMPVPHVELLERLEATESKKHNKAIYKEIKKRSFLKLQQIEEMTKEIQNAGAVYPYIHIEPTQQIHAAMDSARYNIPGLDPNLFSVPEVIVSEVFEPSAKEKTKLVKEFNFYIAITENSELTCILDMLKLVQAEQTLLILGPRSSQGLNTYIVKKITDDVIMPSNQAGNYLNLGMLLPNKIEFNKSALKLFTSERRPYNPIGGWDTQHAGKFISFIEAGSIICASESVVLASKSIESPFYSRDIIFGNSLLYPLAWKEA